jgi:hypothetical protein
MGPRQPADYGGRRFARAVRAVGVGVTAALLVTGCGSEAQPPPSAGSSDSPSASPSTTPTSPSATPQDTDLQARARTAIADLVDRIGVDASDITVVRSEAVTWRDSSIGCPQKGMAYADVLVDGWLVVLEAGGVEYEYHAGSSATGAGALSYCESPQPPLPSQTPA